MKIVQEGAQSDMHAAEKSDETQPEDEYVPGKSLTPSMIAS